MILPKPFYLLLLMVFLLGNCQKPVPKEIEQEPAPISTSDLILPQGFEAIVVVDSIKGEARQLAVNDNGDIYVKLKRADGPFGNVALRDTNQDGRADIIQPFGEYPYDGPYGTAMRIWKGYLYFSSQAAVYRYALTPGELIPKGELQTIVVDDLGPSRREHIGKPLAFDNEGYLYVPFGAPSNACQEPKRTPGLRGQDPCPQLKNFAGIWRFDPDKLMQTQKDGEKIASGIRSLVAMDWNHADQHLYVVMHGRDDLFRLFSGVFSPWQSAVLPSEEFMRIQKGDDYGWPYCYYDQIQQKKVLAPEYGGDGNIVGRCSEYKLPVMGFPGHWAPNDLYFYQGDQFPERYKNGAFIAFHGSTNRAPYPQSGYFIGFVPFKNGLPSGGWEVFADGFSQQDTIIDVSDAVYRPMGIAMGPDGSLYFSETEKGKIWRIRFKGDKKEFNENHLAAMQLRKQRSHIKDPDKILDNLQKAGTAGSKLYDLYCGACHQRNGMGATGRFPTLVNTDWVTGDKKRLIDLVLNGLQGSIEVNGTVYNSVMPQHSYLKDQDIAEILTYIRQSFGNKGDAVSSEEVKLVRDTSK